MRNPTTEYDPTNRSEENAIPTFPNADYLRPLGDACFIADSFAQPICWEHLSAEDAEREWLLLNEWVEYARHAYALPAQVIPPFWHRHRVLVEHLSALRSHWLSAFDPDQNASAPFGWIRDLAEWELRAREIVARLGTRIDSDRPHDIARWPGEPEPNDGFTPPKVCLSDRYEDFCNFVAWDVDNRYLIQRLAYAFAARMAAEAESDN